MKIVNEFIKAIQCNTTISFFFFFFKQFLPHQYEPFMDGHNPLGFPAGALTPAVLRRNAGTDKESVIPDAVIVKNLNTKLKLLHLTQAECPCSTFFSLPFLFL